MGIGLQVLPVTLKENINRLESFIKELDKEQESFRYFKNRDLKALKNHVFTFLLLHGGITVGYGHLDKEGNTVWLGIVVKQEYQGKGYAKKMMQILIDKAKSLGLNSIQLSVDDKNKKALGLYKQYGFEEVVGYMNTSYSILRKDLSYEKENKMSIGISTLAFNKISREDILAIAKDYAWTIEFSSSFPYQEDMVEFFSSINIKRLAHNYFPAPKEPFVINLGSRKEKIRQHSISHCIQGLKISKKAGAPCFSAHAGFCIDPDPNQLGKQLDVNVDIDKDLNWRLFVESVKTIVAEAERINMSFFIENNVTSKFNLRDDGQEVLFCSRAEESLDLINEVGSENFGLLLDTAHLKVSSKSLDFDMNEAVKKLMPYIKYIHHSDNDGTKDTNEAIGADYWFLPWMREFNQCIHVLEVKNIGIEEIKNQIKLLKKYE
tara:strand:- start:12562 stop:13863 length:1302 start_codon:yes stop_codon:yes gene_type:complete